MTNYRIPHHTGFVKQFFEKQGKTIFFKEKRQKNCRKKGKQGKNLLAFPFAQK